MWQSISTSTPKSVDRKRTRQELKSAVTELRRAVRPGAKPGWDVVAWLAALAAGASVAWRAFKNNPATSGEANSNVAETAAFNSPDAADIDFPSAGYGAAGAQRDGGGIATKGKSAEATGTARDGKDTINGTVGAQRDYGDASNNGKSAEATGGGAGDSFAPGASGKGQEFVSASSADRQTSDTDHDTSEGKRPAETSEAVTETGICGAMALAKEWGARFGRDECSMRAAALAFFGVLSLGPILLLALAVAGLLIHDPRQVAGFADQMLAQVLPPGRAAHDAGTIIAQTHVIDAAAGLMRGAPWAVVFGVLSLVYTAISLLTAAAAPMNAAWDVPETRGFLKLRMVCLAVFLGAGELFALSLLPSSGPNIVRSLHIPWLNLPQSVPFWISGLFMLAAWLVDISMFVLLYRFLPNARVTWRAAITGGAVAGLLWELFKKGFAVYLTHFANYNKLYGTLGGAVLMVTWIWYSCILLLGGVIICKMAHEHAEEGGVRRCGAEKHS